ncbi:MAG: extracellular solute-binding protein, partial [Gorillibacterium sp.]|nr:extracellular solute-binding protein [Gorillibacterium sp.]
QMKDDGSILPGMESLDIDSLRAQFAVGKIGMYLTISSEPIVYRDQFPAKVEWAAAPVPTIDGIVRGPSGILGGQWLGLSQDSKHKKEAWAFMNYMYGDGILQQYYEQGFGISMVPAVIAKAKTPNIKGISGFLPNEYDGVWPIPPIVNIRGEEYFDTLFNCIMQEQDVDLVLADLTKRYNEALERGRMAGEVNVEPNPTFVPTQLFGIFEK